MAISQHIFSVQVTSDEFKQIIREIIREELQAMNKAPPAAKDESLLGVQQTAKLLGISPQTVRTYTTKKILTGYRIGNLIKYRRSEVLEKLKQISVIRYGRHNEQKL
jgi:excisionase family DNA binding protein